MDWISLAHDTVQCRVLPDMFRGIARYTNGEELLVQLGDN